MSVRLLTVLALSTLGAGASVPAWADVAPPNMFPCVKASAGDSCRMEEGGSGVCASETCSRLDYGSWDRETMASPPTESYPCLICRPGAGLPAGLVTAIVGFATIVLGLLGYFAFVRQRRLAAQAERAEES